MDRSALPISPRGSFMCHSHWHSQSRKNGNNPLRFYPCCFPIINKCINYLWWCFFLLLRDSASCCLWFSSKQMTFRTGTRWCLSLGDTHIQEAEFAAWRPQTKTTFKCKFSRLHYWSTHSILYSTRVRSCFFFFLRTLQFLLSLRDTVVPHYGASPINRAE